MYLRKWHWDLFELNMVLLHLETYELIKWNLVRKRGFQWNLASLSQGWPQGWKEKYSKGYFLTAFNCALGNGSVIPAGFVSHCPQDHPFFLLWPALQGWYHHLINCQCHQSNNRLSPRGIFPDEEQPQVLARSKNSLQGRCRHRPGSLSPPAREEDSHPCASFKELP